MTTLPCKHLSISIPKPFDAVYGFLADPANWKLWANGLGYTTSQGSQFLKISP